MRASCVGVLFVGVMLTSACSGSDAPTVPEREPQSAVSTTQPSPVVARDAPADSTVPSTAPASVQIEADVAGLDVTMSGFLADSVDPFGQFVSCSGLREAFGTYSVLTSAVEGDVRAISVVSSEQVPGPGVFDATVRVEFAGGEPIDATGTMTIAPGAAAGTFVAFDAEGARVEGTFVCEGDVVAQPLVIGDDDGVLEAVEVFALLRSGDSQRLLGLAANADGAASVECPAAGGAETDSPTVVRVDADSSVGAITSFELTDAATMRMLAGTVSYEFAGVTSDLADELAAGSFSAEADGITVDGAFRCS